MTTDRGEGPQIEVRIEELVLYGFELRDRYRIAEALQDELSRLLAERRLVVASGLAVTDIDGGSIAMTPRMGVEAQGAKIARAMYHEIQAALNARSPRSSPCSTSASPVSDPGGLAEP